MLSKLAKFKLLQKIIWLWFLYLIIKNINKAINRIIRNDLRFRWKHNSIKLNSFRFNKKFNDKNNII